MNPAPPEKFTRSRAQAKALTRQPVMASGAHPLPVYVHLVADATCMSVPVRPLLRPSGCPRRLEYQQRLFVGRRRLFAALRRHEVHESINHSVGTLTTCRLINTIAGITHLSHANCARRALLSSPSSHKCHRLTDMGR